MLIFCLFSFKKPSIQFGSYLESHLWLLVPCQFGFQRLYCVALNLFCTYNTQELFWNLGSNLNCSSHIFCYAAFCLPCKCLVQGVSRELSQIHTKNEGVCFSSSAVFDVPLLLSVLQSLVFLLEI